MPLTEKQEDKVQVWRIPNLSYLNDKFLCQRARLGTVKEFYISILMLSECRILWIRHPVIGSPFPTILIFLDLEAMAPLNTIWLCHCLHLPTTHPTDAENPFLSSVSKVVKHRLQYCTTPVADQVWWMQPRACIGYPRQKYVSSTTVYYICLNIVLS